ncbi:MAG TPA: protein YgfX [Burkholderiaceae bacterium]|nr:protein YgfX [Burkholderiaceae bacterium]
MSIAIYAVIKPSPTLHVLTCGMCLGVLSIAAVVALGAVGQLLPPASRILISICCFFIAFSVFYQRIRSRSEFHIHISGSGQIRLAECKSAGPGKTNKSSLLAKMDMEARLMPATTIWSWLLLLRLQLDDRRVVVVPILPDCVPPSTFRALSVACRWLAAHDHSMKY